MYTHTIEKAFASLYMQYDKIDAFLCYERNRDTDIEVSATIIKGQMYREGQNKIWRSNFFGFVIQDESKY